MLGWERKGATLYVPRQPFEEARFMGDGSALVNLESAQNIAARLHGTQRRRTEDVRHVDVAKAQGLAEQPRLRFANARQRRVFGERFGRALAMRHCHRHVKILLHVLACIRNAILSFLKSKKGWCSKKLTR